MYPSQGGAGSCEYDERSPLGSPCRAVDEATGQPCCESEALEILDQFDRHYRGRIAQVEAEEGADDAHRNELKLKIMTDWVKDLEDQNAMLVKTVHELEEAAVSRVKLLENKLLETSNLMSHNMSHPNKSEEELNELSERVGQLMNNQSNMQSRICHLQSDIKNLLQFIKRGRIENNWDLDGLNFYEIQPSDIPAPPDCTCDQEKGDADNVRNTYFVTEVEDSENERKLFLYQYELEDKISELIKQLDNKNDIIKKYLYEMTNLRDSLKYKVDKNCGKEIKYFSSNIDSAWDISSMIENQESSILEKDLENDKLREDLRNTMSKMNMINDRMHDYECKVNCLQMNIDKKCKENDDLVERLACLEKESIESREALTQEVAQKHDLIVKLKDQLMELQDEVKNSNSAIKFKDEIITRLKKDLQESNKQKASNATRRVRICTEPYQKVEDKSIEDRLHDTTKQLEECKNQLVSKDIEISKLRTVLSENQAENKMDGKSLHNVSAENQNEIVSCLKNLLSSMEEENEIILSLKTEYETVLNNLKQTKNAYEQDIALANEKLQEIQSCICNYRSEVIDQEQSKDNTKELITTIENKIIYVQKLFQNKCEMCIKENLLSKIKEMTLQVTSGIRTLSEIHENKIKAVSSIGNMITQNNTICNRNRFQEVEQKAIFAAILQQFRMMEEFRICTVEVQGATEDLREEVSAVLSNLNSRHCKYVELTKMVNQVQDYLTRTRENISEVINRLELQDEERARHSERIINNRIRLKDLKNEFNQTQSELSKCLNTVQNNIQQTNLLGYAEIHTCNDLLISVAEEVEQIVCNLHTFQTQGCCTLSTMTELRKQLTVMEHNVKELKKKSDQVLLENETAQKSFTERSKRLEKYECEIDNCHTKMQDVLDCIIATRDQMNEFGCIKETEDSFQSTNETIKIKDDLRKLHKEYEELKLRICQEAHSDKQDETISEWENRVSDLQDQIKVLQNEIKIKQETNIFLRERIELLEKELDSVRAKAEEYRRCSSTECLELKKRIFELENSLKVQKDTENNLSCLANNETDSKKSQFLDYINKDRHYDSILKRGLQGSHENIPQLFKVLQETIQAIKNGLQELADEFKRLVPEGSSNTLSSNDSVKAALESLAKYAESIKYCSFEVEKIKVALYSKDKLMENMDQIIKIQKDSLTISQSEVEDLHKALQEKIDAQGKAISQCEKEKRQLTKQIELQVQTIGHLQDAVVEAKRTIDQLSNKAASDLIDKHDSPHINSIQTRFPLLSAKIKKNTHGLYRRSFNKNQVIRSLNLYLTETQSQYGDCFAEASEQGALLELQRDAISTLQKKISFLECDEFLNAFMLHFVYYVILFKYQKEVETLSQRNTDMKCRVDELVYAKNYFEKECETLACKCKEANGELERLRNELKDYRKKLNDKHCELVKLLNENDSLKKQLEVFKLDFDLIEEEMKKMGMRDSSVTSFKMELETMRSENERFRCEVEQYKKLINNLKYTKDCLLNQLECGKDVELVKYKEKIVCLQQELNAKNEKINFLEDQLNRADKIITGELQTIEDLHNKIKCNEHCMKINFSNFQSFQEKVCMLQKHIDNLNQMLNQKSIDIKGLKKDNEVLQETNKILKVALAGLKNEKRQIDCKLKEAQKFNENTSQTLVDILKRRSSALVNPESCICNKAGIQKEDKRSEEIVKKLTKDLEVIKEKYSEKSAVLSETQAKLKAVSDKLDSSERSCKRQKDEITLLEKKLACEKQKLQSCIDKNTEFVNKNKALEDNNNKCMEELEDIVLQLEDMQSSLVELRTECDTKSQSLDCVSVELAKMRVSRSEVCEESKYVLNWVRVWMREQKRTAGALRDKLLRISTDKKNFMNTMKQLKRANRVLTWKLKQTRKPVTKQTAIVSNCCSLPYQQIHNNSFQQNESLQNGRIYSVYSVKKKCRKGTNHTEDKITTHGDYRLFSTLQHLSNEIPRIPQISENIRNEKKTHEDIADYGYQTSSSK